MKLLVLWSAISLSAASAAPVPFTGTLGDGFDLHSLFVTGPGFQFESVLPEGGHGSVGYMLCNSTCDLSETFNAAGSPLSGYVATYQGRTIRGYGSSSNGIVGGYITFQAPLFHTSDCGGPAGDEVCSGLPMTFTGDLFARFHDGSVLFDFPVSGTGSLTPIPLINEGLYISVYQVRGELTGEIDDPDPAAAPEPATWTLVAISTLGLAGARRLKGA